MSLHGNCGIIPPQQPREWTQNGPEMGEMWSQSPKGLQPLLMPVNGGARGRVGACNPTATNLA